MAARGHTHTHTHAHRRGKISHVEWRKKRTECRICGKVMQNASIKRHMKQKHGVSGEEYLCCETEGGIM